MGKELEVTDQTNLLPKKQLVTVFIALSGALFITFVDQNGIGVTLPTIGEELHATNTISWAGTSALIANTVFQVLYGRMSDIFGRKVVFLSALGLLALGDLLCGFSRTATQLYVFRGIAGLANGGITALCMMIVSDIVTLEQRGKYQGILGAMVGLGNTIGPFLAAAMTQKATWRGLFWLISPLVVVIACIIAWILPSTPMQDGFVEKAKKIDFAGVATSSIALVLIMIPISGGGTYFAWDGALVISMLVIGALSAVVFVIVEWRFARLPMMPLRLFTNPPLCAILVQNFLLGMVYYSDLYYLTIYYQNVRGYGPIVAAALFSPLVLGQMFASVGSGQYISRKKRYGEVIWVGYFLWTLGAGLKCLWNRNTHPAVIVIILLIEGIGCGNVFQPTLVAAQAHATKADRAVVISVRNFIRSFGGSAGLAISASLLANVLQKMLPTSLPASIATTIKASPFHMPDLSVLTASQRSGVLDAYMAASRAVFIFMVPLMALCLVLCVLVKDQGLQPKDERERKAMGSAGSSNSDVEKIGIENQGEKTQMSGGKGKAPEKVES